MTPARMEFPNARIIIFAKAPVAGEAKTRLIPALGAEGAARLHGRLMERTLAWTCAAALAPVELHCAGPLDHPLFREQAQRHGIQLQPQQGEDLGARMHHALDTALREVERAVLIGTDCPWMEAAQPRRALEALTANDAVVGPAEDGGYVLIGLRRPAPELFREIPWGGPQVLARTRARAAAAGITLAELPPLPDLDRPEDLSRLRREIPELYDFK